MSGDGSLLAIGTNEALATLWEADSGKQLRTLVAFPFAADNTSVALSDDGKVLVTASSGWPDKSCTWDTASGKKLRTFEMSANTYQGVLSLAMSSNGKHVVVGTIGNAAILWEVNGKKLQTFPHPHRVTSVAVSGDGTLVASLRKRRRQCVPVGDRLSISCPSKSMTRWFRSASL